MEPFGSIPAPFFDPILGPKSAPLRGALLSEKTRKPMVLELFCPPKRLVLGGSFGYNSGSIFGTFWLDSGPRAGSAGEPDFL